MIAIDTIVVPQGAEYKAVCRGLQRANTKDVRVIPIPIGVGQMNKVISKYSEVINEATYISIVGLCGGLSNAHAVGDTVLIERCQDFEREVYLDRGLTATIQQKLSLSLVTALTSDRVITQSQEKLALAQQYSVSIVEMEGYSYVKALQSQGKKVAMLRAVSDDANGNIPDLNRAIDHRGNLLTLPMAIALMKQPFAAVNLIRGSLAGLKALEQVIAKLFAV